jgi:hypothetical protein
MSRALITAYALEKNGYASNETAKSSLRDFAEHAKNEHKIKDLRHIEREHVLSYAERLNERYEGGEISASTAQNYLSQVNVALENARLDQKCRVEAVKEAGLAERSGIALHDKSATEADHNKAVSSVSNRLSAQLELQRTFGLRFKESCLIDAKSALREATTTGKVRIENGTKGGREREIAITQNSQITALQRCAEIQKNEHSLVPESQTWSQYQSQSYREIEKTSITFHQERHHYANERYEQLAGCKSPVRSGVEHAKHIAYIANKLQISTSEAKALDQSVRQQIAVELGHNRISITNSYLG